MEISDMELSEKEISDMELSEKEISDMEFSEKETIPCHLFPFCLIPIFETNKYRLCRPERERKR